MILLILAAGLGSRYGGDKQVDDLGPKGEWIMDLNLRDACEAGFERTVVVCRPAMVARIETHLSRFAPAGMRCDCVVQKAEDLPRAMTPRARPWGTGHALLAARALLDEPFLVANADDCYGPGCFTAAAAFLAHGCLAGRGALVAYELGRCCSTHGTVSRGVCRCDDSGRLRQVVEHHGIIAHAGICTGTGPEGPVVLAADTPVSLNSWCLHPGCCPALWALLDDWLAAGPDTDDEFQLPTALDLLLRRGDLTIELRHCREPWLGMTYREDRDRVAAHLAERCSACQVRLRS